LRLHWRHLLALGLLNAAVPLCLFAYAELRLTAGFGAVLNAAAPLFAAIAARAWHGERFSPSRIAGLVLGFAGVVVLVGDSSFVRSVPGSLAVAAALLATALYGVASSYTRHFLAGVAPLAVAAGTQLAATLALAPFAVWLWPARMPSIAAWLHVFALGAGCTGIAYTLFYRLVANIGPARAASVSFLIPVFGVFWGVVMLDERVSTSMAIGCAVIALGTAMSSGVLGRRTRAPGHAADVANPKRAFTRSGR
jgi:drug/metabolite transporter (DMT)-like permease